MNQMKITIYFILFLSTVSCKRESKNELANAQKQDNLVANIDKENSSRFSREDSDNITDLIYAEIIKNDATLKKLDEDQKNIHISSQRQIIAQQNLLDQPKNFFNSNNQEIDLFIDSELKLKIKITKINYKAA